MSRYHRAPISGATCSTVERELMLGGRALAEKVSSTYMDKPFEGYGLSGYDNVSKEFWSTWNDNMGTGIMLSTGQCDNKGACTHSGSYMDAMINAKKTVRMTSHEEGPDREGHLRRSPCRRLRISVLV